MLDASDVADITGNCHGPFTERPWSRMVARMDTFRDSCAFNTSVGWCRHVPRLNTGSAYAHALSVDLTAALDSCICLPTLGSRSFHCCTSNTSAHLCNRKDSTGLPGGSDRFFMFLCTIGCIMLYGKPVLSSA